MHRRTPSWLLSTWPQPARCSPCLSCVCAVTLLQACKAITQVFEALATLQSPLHPCTEPLQPCKAFSHPCIMPLQLCKAFSHYCMKLLQPCKAFSHPCRKVLQPCKARYAGVLSTTQSPLRKCLEPLSTAQSLLAPLHGGSECRSKPVTPLRVRASSVQARSPCSTATTAPPTPPASGIPPHVPRVRAAEPPRAAPSPASPARGSVL